MKKEDIKKYKKILKDIKKMRLKMRNTLLTKLQQ